MKANPGQLGFLSPSLEWSLRINPPVASLDSGEDIGTTDVADERAELRQRWRIPTAALHDGLTDVALE